MHRNRLERDGPELRILSGRVSHIVFCVALSRTGSFRRQPFQFGNEHFFGDGEELEDRAPESRQEKTTIKTDVDQCRNKASQVIAAETVETLTVRSGFEWLAFQLDTWLGGILPPCLRGFDIYLNVELYYRVLFHDASILEFSGTKSANVATLKVLHRWLK